MTSTPDYNATPVPRTPDRDRLEFINDLLADADTDDEREAIFDDYLEEGEKHPTQFTYVERRAYLYRKVEEKADPKNLDRSQRELGDLFGVSQKTISNDLQAVREFIGENVGNLAVERTELLAHDTVESLREDGEHRKAWKTHKEYMEWLFEAGFIEKEPDRLEVDVDPEDAYMQMLAAEREEADD